MAGKGSNVPLWRPLKSQPSSDDGRGRFAAGSPSSPGPSAAAAAAGAGTAGAAANAAAAMGFHLAPRTGWPGGLKYLSPLLSTHATPFLSSFCRSGCTYLREARG